MRVRHGGISTTMSLSTRRTAAATAATAGTRHRSSSTHKRPSVIRAKQIVQRPFVQREVKTQSLHRVIILEVQQEFKILCLRTIDEPKIVECSPCISIPDWSDQAGIRK